MNAIFLALAFVACQYSPSVTVVTVDAGGEEESYSPDPSNDENVDQPDESDHPDSSWGILSAEWNRMDGIVVSWEPYPDASHEVVLMDGNGQILQRVTVTGSSHELSGLSDGEYQLQVEATTDEGVVLGTNVSVSQLVGVNRIVYRSEVAHHMGMDVWGVDDIVVMAGGKNDNVGLLIVDTADPKTPKTLATINGIGYVRDVKIVDDILYTAVDPESDNCSQCDEIGIRIFDFSVPSEPVLLSEIGFPAHQIHNMWIEKGILYAASMFEGMMIIYDVSNPSDPTRIGTWSFSTFPVPSFTSGPAMAPHDMVVVDDVLYVAHGFGFHEVDVSDPYNPVDLNFNQVQMGGHNIMPLANPTYTATSREVVGGALQIWKRHDDGSYEEVAQYSTGDDHCIHNVMVKDNLIFASWYVDGLLVFDATDPHSLELVGWYDTFHGDWDLHTAPNGAKMPAITGAWGVWPYGKHIALSDNVRGLVILDYIPIVNRPD